MPTRPGAAVRVGGKRETRRGKSRLSGEKPQRGEFRESEGKRRAPGKLNFTGREVSLLRQGSGWRRGEGPRRTGPGGGAGRGRGRGTAGTRRVSGQGPGREHTRCELGGAGEESLRLRPNRAPQYLHGGVLGPGTLECDCIWGQGKRRSYGWQSSVTGSPSGGPDADVQRDGPARTREVDGHPHRDRGRPAPDVRGNRRPASEPPCPWPFASQPSSSNAARIGEVTAGRMEEPRGREREGHGGPEFTHTAARKAPTRVTPRGSRESLEHSPCATLTESARDPSEPAGGLGTGSGDGAVHLLLDSELKPSPGVAWLFSGKLFDDISRARDYKQLVRPNPTDQNTTIKNSGV